MPRSTGFEILPLLLLALLAGAACNAVPEQPVQEPEVKTPMQVTHRATTITGTTADASYQARPIVVPVGDPAVAPPAPPADPAAGYPGAFGGPRLNSRLAAAVPAGPMSVKFSAALRAGSVPGAVMYCGERIVVVSESWQLFDRDGKPVRDELSGMSPVMLDAERNALFHVAGSGDFLVCGLSDGKRAYALMPSGGDRFRYPWVGRHGDRILLAATERSLDPHGRQQASTSSIEVIDVGGPQRIGPTSSKLLLSAKSLGKLEFPTPEMIAAGGDGLVVAAVSGKLFFVGDDLKIRSALEGAFTPVTMSLDETGRVYLVARVADGLELHVITPAGELLWKAKLADDLGATGRPPVVGYDHRVYVLGKARIAAFGADGTPLFECKPKAAIAGAAVSTDGHLLLASGGEVGVFDAEGQYRTIHEFAGETVRTAAVATERGEILVATDTKLYCLDASPGK